MGKTMLNVGCGDHKIPNFINVDINPNADICFDVRKGLPFKNSSVDGIYSEHFIEHLSQSDGISFFRECRRVLKSFGCIRIATPDLDYITKRYFSENWFKDPDLKRFGYEWVNNPCEQINISMREWGHKWLYNEEELTRIASYAGFSKYKRFNIGISDNSDFANLEYRASSRLIVEFYKIDKPILEKNPLVSILIPAYNSKYFEDAIKSAINQTYENIEIIIGDDNPTSNKIFKTTKKYANNNDKIQYYKNPTNLNAKVNMIKLFDSARGEYIKFLNDDDILHPTCVERMVHFLNNFPNITLVTSHRQRIDHHGNNLKDIPETTRPVTDDSIIDGVSMANMMLYTGKNFIGEPTTVMFRKSDLLDSKPNFLSFAGREAYAIVDQTMWVNLLSRGDAIYLIDTLSYFRIHPEQRQQQKSFFPTIAPAISQLRFDAKRMGFLRKYDKIKLHTKPLSSNENSRIGNCNSDIIYLQPNDKVKSNNTISARAKCIAFYLPQYHPIPENNIWWGEGFTEWTNVTKAKPLYDGHYQPHLPANLGFYDLRVPETREAQANLAKDHGIYGFCYYHYWFNGKRLLERPFQEILSSGEPSFPFCLCWANENWTRAWDGRQGEVLIKQNYSEKDDRDHIKYLLNIFKDKRYIRIKGRPLMLIYLSTRLPNAKRTTEIWREEAQKQGEELYICKVESAPYEYGDPSKSGFDASVEFQPDWGNLGPLKSQLSNGHHVYDYSNVVKRMLNKPIPTYKRYPCVTPMWDNSPRRKKSSLILDNSTPEAYELWLSETVSSLNKRDLDDDIIFINAWNEWGEGNHLEPDRRHGLKYLESTKKVLNSSFSYPSTKGLVSIIILTYNQLEYSKLCVNSIIENTEIPYEIIFVDNGSLDGTVKWLKDLCKRHPNFRLIKNVTNMGFAVGCNQGIEAASGEYILLLNNDVIVTPNWLTGMLNCIKSDIKSGIVGPMTNNISGSQRVPRVTYKSPDDLPAYAKQFYKNHRYRRILNQRIVGFCMLFHRNLVERIGMLDASFGTGNFEDDDFCLRSVLHGYHNYIAADVFIHHFGSRSFIGNNIDYQDVLNNNKTLFLDKWSVVKRDDPLFEELFLVNCSKRADELINLGLYDKAEKRLLDGIRRLPGRHKLVYKLSDCLLDSNCYEDALQLLGAIPHSNLRTEGLITKGHCHEGLGQFDEAEDIANQLCSNEMAKAPGWNLKGVIAYRKGDFKNAESCFNRSIECDPSFAEPHANLGIILWENGNQDDALSYFAKSFMLSPTSRTNAAHYHAAAINCRAVDQAQINFLEAKALFPLNKQITNLHIDLLIRQGDHHEAMKAIENAILLFGIEDGMLKAALEVRHQIGPVRIDPPHPSRPTVTLCMIVKNEEHYLPRCLASLKPIADEMIIVDTGSTDATRDIAEVFGAQVFDHEWHDDFSAARNLSLEKASGDWILVMDADEVIAASDHCKLLDLITTSESEKSAYVLTTRTYTDRQDSADYTKNTGQYNEEMSTGWVPSKKVRLFPNQKGVHFVFPVHEQVDPVLTEMGVSIIESSVPVHHYGKLDRARTSERWKTYYDIGHKKLASQSDSDHALKELAIQAGLLSKWEEAATHWKSFIDRNPNSVDGYLNLTRVMANCDDYEQANEYANKAFQLAGDRSDTIYNLALSELQTGQAVKAAQTAAKMVEIFPDDPDGKLLQAIAEICAGKIDYGTKLFYKLSKKFPIMILFPRIRSILCSIKSAGFDEWLVDLKAELSKVINLNESVAQPALPTAKKAGIINKTTAGVAENTSTLLEKAVRNYERENYQASIDTLNLIIASEPNHWAAYSLLMDVLLQSGNETAISKYFHPLERRTNLPADILALLGTGYEASGDLEKAAAFCDKAIAVGSDCSRAWNLKGVIAYRNGYGSEAAQFFQKAAECDEKCGDPWTNMGTLHWNQGVQDKAIDCFETGFQLSPTCPNIATTYHIAISETGQYERARPLFEQAVKLCPDFRKGLFLLIDILIRMEAYEEALNQIETVLVGFGADPQFLEAAKTIRDKVGPMTIKKGKHPSLSLCMIVKNEEKYLPRCLESLKPMVDEMIVVDTGSDDNTRDIANIFGARVFEFEWNDDFSAARNLSLEHASGDLILVMDADEVIAAKDHKNILKLLDNAKYNHQAFMVVTRNYTNQYNIIGWKPNDGQYPDEEGGAGWIPSEKVRIFTNHKDIRFEYPVHEVVGPALSRMGITVKSFPYPVHHYGKMDQNNDRQKDERYYKIGIDKLSASSKDPVAIREMAVQAAKLEKFEDSISLWKRFIEIEPEDPRSYINLASVYGKLKQYQKARDVAQIATRLAPDVKEAQLNLGLSELHLGNTSKAKEIFQKLVKSDHNYLSAVFLLGAAQICHGDMATGNKTLKRLKGLSIWDNLSYSLQEIVEGLIEADWPELALNLIKAADRLDCSNDAIKEFARNLEIKVTTKKADITLSAIQRTDNTILNATVM